MNQASFKTCRYCAEKIAAQAKVCPRCRQWLSLLSWRNPMVLVGAICLWMALSVIVFDSELRKLLRPGVDFLPYKNQISIAESHMIFGTNYYVHAPFVGVIAIVTNQTGLAWKELPLEVRFFDKAGTMIDVGRGAYSDTLYPGADGAVQINANAGTLRPLADYASYKIYVGNARDARSPF